MAKSAQMSPFTVSVAGREEAVHSGLTEVMTCLSTLELSPDEADTTELVLAEALNNVVEHALANAQTQTMIEVRGSHSAQGLELTIIDQGVPMPDGTAPTAKQPDLDVDVCDLPEGGFGWFLIHTLATRVQYARKGQANHLTLVLPVGL